MEEEKYKKNTNHGVIFSNHPPAAIVGKKNQDSIFSIKWPLYLMYDLS
jgi:hypothetical protein